MDQQRKNNKQLCEIVKIFKGHFEEESIKRGLFGIEYRADLRANELKAELIQEEIQEYNRGYEGSVRRCPKCGKSQKYRGDRSKTVKFECGEFKIQRAYYYCEYCNTSSVPLDSKLGIVEGKEQGKLREKLCLIGVLVPYHQGPEACRTLLGQEEFASSLRRIVLKESERYSEEEKGLLKSEQEQSTEDDTVYLEVDGHMCPTRDVRKGTSDQGYREAKVVMGFKDTAIANVSKGRNEILNLILKGQIAPASTFTNMVKDVYEQINARDAGRVVFLADGAKWIWNIANEIAPEAIQILDYSHAKSYLWKAADIIFGKDSDLRGPWIKKQKNLLFEDNVSEVIIGLKEHLKNCPSLQEVITYIENNQTRMLYGKYRSQGLMIGSGAIESAGKRIAQGRIKGAGMRWNVPDLNVFLKLRCSFIDRSWKNFWNTQYAIAA